MAKMKNMKIDNKEDQLTKDETAALMAKPGNVRGLVFLANFEYIKQKGGEGAVKEVKKKLEELGHPLETENISPMEFYPEALSVLIILLAREALNLSENEIFEMGGAIIKLSPFTKILTRYFISIKKIFEEAPKYWRKFFDFGKLETVELNEKGRYATIRVFGYEFHPIMCIYHKGYFGQAVRLSFGKKTAIKIEEVKCAHRGDPYHEYRLSWN